VFCIKAFYKYKDLEGKKSYKVEFQSGQ